MPKKKKKSRIKKKTFKRRINKIRKKLLKRKVGKIKRKTSKRKVTKKRPITKVQKNSPTELIFKTKKEWIKNSLANKSQYQNKYNESVKNNNAFWKREGKTCKIFGWYS